MSMDDALKTTSPTKYRDIIPFVCTFTVLHRKSHKSVLESSYVQSKVKVLGKCLIAYMYFISNLFNLVVTKISFS